MSAIPTTQHTAPTGASQPAGPDRQIVLHQLYAACMLILAGAVIGLVGSRVADATTAATVGTAVIGAGAALLPSGVAHARANRGSGASD
jgi:hypothetical protein